MAMIVEIAALEATPRPMNDMAPAKSISSTEPPIAAPAT
jgi:hypothetical protein